MCNKCYVLKTPLVPMLTSATVAATSPALLASASIVIVVGGCYRSDVDTLKYHSRLTLSLDPCQVTSPFYAF
jgi:hypothetical protein